MDCATTVVAVGGGDGIFDGRRFGHPHTRAPIVPIQATVAEPRKERLPGPGPVSYIQNARRGDALSPVRAFIPSDISAVGFVSRENEIEPSLWRPFGQRHVIYIIPGDGGGFAAVGSGIRGAGERNFGGFKPINRRLAQGLWRGTSRASNHYKHLSDLCSIRLVCGQTLSVKLSIFPAKGEFFPVSSVEINFEFIAFSVNLGTKAKPVGLTGWSASPAAQQHRPTTGGPNVVVICYSGKSGTNGLRGAKPMNVCSALHQTGRAVSRIRLQKPLNWQACLSETVPCL